jgi:hypothetical protein
VTTKFVAEISIPTHVINLFRTKISVLGQPLKMIFQNQDGTPEHSKNLYGPLMVLPMAVVMMLLMGKMYPNKKFNTAIVVTGIVLLGVIVAAS